MALPVKVASCFGVLEHWSIGVLEKAKAQISTRMGPFITPLLHHSITPADFLCGERLLKSPREAAQSRFLWVRILYFPFPSKKVQLACDLIAFLAVNQSNGAELAVIAWLDTHLP